MSGGAVLLAVAGGIGVITLSQPDTLNAQERISTFYEKRMPAF